MATQVQLPVNSFLSGVHVLPVQGSGIEKAGVGQLDPWLSEIIEFKTPLVTEDATLLPNDAAAAFGVPVFCDGSLTSIVVLCATKTLPPEVDAAEPVGVFEVWRPIGPYEEVHLASGYYGKMERFHNVSSFVRFERGTGLPGQVWEKGVGVIHDDLSNHPGFLRAAGASADLLQTAIGFPVVDADFIASVLLISSGRTPIARGFEVWHRSGDDFELLGGSYRGLAEGFVLPNGSKCSSEVGWASKLTAARGAVLSESPADWMGVREVDPDSDSPRCGLAIPQFRGSELTGFVALLF
ncbi:MAG: GAF domain-containing protein [Planctomycetota bacterium]